MTRETAIKGLKAFRKEFSGYKPNEEMFDMAIQALEQEPTTKNDLGVDCISRADAIKLLENYGSVEITNKLKDLPTVYPKSDKPSGITTKQLEAMYESYEKSLWREREDIRGDDMVLLSDAMAFLQEELCMLGCWNDEEQGENT